MQRDFGLLKQDQGFDLLVCGGGIYGAWTAYDAALRGLKVALVEQGDWACATSSASSKLIHGGLRYLEQWDFKLVRKALAERRRLLHIAPHRVWPLRFGVPVYSGGRIGKWRLTVGLALYGWLAGDAPANAYRQFDSKGFAARFPCLSGAGLQGGFSYADAQTDDARLVLELIDGAMAAGAVCVNYCRLTDYCTEQGRVVGAWVQDEIGGGSMAIQARQWVNTIGAWAASAGQGKHWCRLSLGVHLVLPGVLSGEALLLTARSDGRFFFVIPWYGRTLVGTTDTEYCGDPNRIGIDAAHCDYLLAEANHFLQTAWSQDDIIGCYAGLRVLKPEDKDSLSAVSRDWTLETLDNGLHYSIGGKITSAREDAARIVDTVCGQLGIAVPCQTQARPFPWAPDGDYSAWSLAMASEAGRLGIDPDSALWLIRRHGSRAGEIFRLVEQDARLAARIIPSLPFIQADLRFCAANEMAVHLHDLLRRRLPLSILAKPAEIDLRRLALSVADSFGWDEAALQREIDACRCLWSGYGGESPREL